MMVDGDTIVIADAHVDEANVDELACFLAFLTALQTRALRRLLIVGDLFNLWVGTPHMRLPHHHAVVDALQALRRQGLTLIYIEGNRDYFLAPMYLHAPFDVIASEAVQEKIGGKTIYFSHGDLVNVDDRQYRLWRSVSRSWAVSAAFRALPRGIAVSLARYVERTLRGTNQKHKQGFPLEACQTYAEQLWKRGNDIIVLGHFHEQRHHEDEYHRQRRHLYVLPAWKDTHTYLQIDAHGTLVFRQFACP
ncbi:hypothetical protein GF339_19525 [candidate division KSB3 bacterium]|uniref:UDP-2,3-diacylglucosamine diphosphatase n=1 Tax=candidate division KSB3 bacterium TaxID=2044937 RepID=A0A9D5JYM3_9BACT|nr:hypothetical protein [candidate division KSB3 bacterium]MBD3326784.1 hypothetical protein [candidate division KSB3 bacterium]